LENSNGRSTTPTHAHSGQSPAGRRSCGVTSQPLSKSKVLKIAALPASASARIGGLRVSTAVQGERLGGGASACGNSMLYMRWALHEEGRHLHLHWQVSL